MDKQPDKQSGILGIFILGLLAGLLVSGLLRRSYDSELEALSVQISAVSSSVQSLRESVNEIDSHIDNFSDGYTNWRDIVSEIESQWPYVKSNVNGLEEE